MKTVEIRDSMTHSIVVLNCATCGIVHVIKSRKQASTIGRKSLCPVCGHRAPVMAIEPQPGDEQ